MLTALLGVGVWAPAAVASAADPCCTVQLSGVPQSFQAGAGATQFGSSMTVNPAANPQIVPRSITAVLAIQAPNLNSGQVNFAWHDPQRGWQRAGVGRHDGVLVATFAPFRFQAVKVGTVSPQLRLTFGGKVPAQNITLTLALTVDYGHGQRQSSQSGPANSSIVAVAAPPPPTPTPTPTPAPTPTPTPSATPSATASTPSQAASAPSSAGVAPFVPTIDATPASSGSSIGWIFYIIGGLLLVAGIAIIGTLLWKRGSDPAADDPSGYPDPNYPVQQYPPQTYPTQTYGSPSVPPPTTYLPPTNYGGGNPPLDPTRQFPPLE